jgi:putative endonuclease
MATAYRVYVLQKREDRFYIGLTEDVPRRIDQHNSGGSRWTKTRGPWTLAWQSANLSLSDARKLENRLKRQGRGSGFYSLTGLKRKPSL